VNGCRRQSAVNSAHSFSLVILPLPPASFANVGLIFAVGDLYLVNSQGLTCDSGIDVAQEPARGKRGRDDPAKPSIFSTGTTVVLPQSSSSITTTSCSVTNIRTGCTTTSNTLLLEFHLCFSPATSLLATSAPPKRLSATRQHLRRTVTRKTERSRRGGRVLRGRRAAEPSFHAQRRLSVLEAQEKNTGSVRSLASQKATTCCPCAIVAEGRSATFLHVLCICAPPPDSSA
jgi:hypothetical protein